MSRIARNKKILRFFVETQRSFALYNFPLVNLCFSHLPEGASESNYTNSTKIEKNRDHEDFLQFTFSCSLLACLASQTALPNSTNSGKMPKNRCQNDLLYLTIFRYCFVLFSLTREGLRIQLIVEVPKIVLFPHFRIFPYVFIT